MRSIKKLVDDVEDDYSAIQTRLIQLVKEIEKRKKLVTNLKGGQDGRKRIA
jgi:cell division septum initiation protein DivIVA